MRILMYSTRSYDKISFREVFSNSLSTIDFTESQLNEQTVEMAKGYDAICIFVNDICDDCVCGWLYSLNVKLVLCRCVGTNNVDLQTAKNCGITVKNVPAYSPESVAEHALALLMAVDRRICKAYNRVRDNNFSLSGLSGYCLHGKTVGIIGYGKIGQCFGDICSGLGMTVLAYDPKVVNTGDCNIIKKQGT